VIDRRTFVGRALATSALGPLAIHHLAAERATAAQDDPPADRAVRVAIRSRERAPGAESATEKTGQRELAAPQTAILICDMWNQHWCRSATRRCGELAEKMAPLVDQARARGLRIVHSPSDTLDFYRDHPARQRALAVPAAVPPTPITGGCPLEKSREGSLPIDDSDGGCDCQPQCKNYKAWTREHPAIPIAEIDLISDNGQEVYNYFVQQGIKNVLYVGVHTNMCVLGRSFGIRQMTRLGFNTLLVRDLTDTMYNPRQRPFVEHAAGTELVVKHIEEHWCPTLVSRSLAEGLR
jgi:nicotinamidase-related amidase